jgi:serine/threonine protein phosphatase PrpC
MGGHKAGEAASSESIKAFDEYFSHDRVELMRNDALKIREHMESVFFEVNAKILRMGEDNAEYAGMGCALIMVFIHDGLLHTCHAGDVRCYVCNASGIFQLTNDHTEVAELVRAGRMSPEEARRSPLKSVLTEAIGASGPISPEYNSYTLAPKDRILLCSDGLWGMLADREIWTTAMRKKKVGNICRELIARANAAGGKDNITAIVMET